jgi:hypothetical protein
MEKFVEAIDAMRESDDAFQIGRAGRRFSRYLSEVRVNPRQSRGEHFGVTRLRISPRQKSEPTLVEERVRFPLGPEDQRSWFRKPAKSLRDGLSSQLWVDMKREDRS